MIAIEDEKQGSKIWEDDAAIEEMNEVKREALSCGAIAQGQEMEAFEWFKYVEAFLVEVPCARKTLLLLES